MTDPIRATSPQSWRNLGRELTPREQYAKQAREYLPNAHSPVSQPQLLRVPSTPKDTNTGLASSLPIPIPKTMENLDRSSLPPHVLKMLDSGEIGLDHYLLNGYFNS